MLALIRQRMKQRNVTNIETVASTVTDPKLPAGKVDTILMVDVYEFSHPYEMTAMVKALKPGGRLVSSSIDWKTKRCRSNWFTR